MNELPFASCAGMEVLDQLIEELARINASVVALAEAIDRNTQALTERIAEVRQ